MAVELKTAEQWAEYDTTRVREGVREIARSPNLRFFLRSMLNAFGANQTPFALNPAECARLCGRHEAAMDIIATILEHEANLYPALILEDQNEQSDRASAQ
jgi:hypothetical protein